MTDSHAPRQRSTGRRRARGIVERRLRQLVFGREAHYAGDPGRRLRADHTVTAPGRVVQYHLDDGAEVVVGRWSGISHTAVLMPGGQHNPDWVSAVHVHYDPAGWVFPETALNSGRSGGITIGSDVLIGYEALVLAGVTIGHGAIVASRAVVTKDVEPYAIVGGNPARHIRFRFDDATRAALLRIAWWDWPEEKVLALRHEIDSPDVQGFVARHDPARARTPA